MVLASPFVLLSSSQPTKGDNHDSNASEIRLLPGNSPFALIVLLTLCIIEAAKKNQRQGHLPKAVGQRDWCFAENLLQTLPCSLRAVTKITHAAEGSSAAVAAAAGKGIPPASWDLIQPP